TTVRQLAAGIGDRAAQLPVLGCAPFDARLAAADVGVGVARTRGRAAHRAHVIEGDVVGHAPGVGRHPDIDTLAGIAHAYVELGGAFGLHAGEGVDGAVGTAVGREQLPIVGHALGVADAGVPAQGLSVDVLLEAHERRWQCFRA